MKHDMKDVCVYCAGILSEFSWCEYAEREVHPTQGSGGGIHYRQLLRFCSKKCIRSWLISPDYREIDSAGAEERGGGR